MPPNVLLFISDQQRADTMPGSTRVDAHTPHAAWLAQNGVSFDRAFCACPICTPARGSILSGLFPNTTGVVANYEAHTPLVMPENTKLIADFLGPDGYVCGYTGKWHLPTGDDRRGFTDYAARLSRWDVDSEESDDAVAFGRRIGLDIGNTYTEYLSKAPDDPMGGGATTLPLAHHCSTLMASRAAEFVRSREGEDRPFLLTYSCIEPHPLGMVYNIAPCPFDRMYDPEDMYLPETCRDPLVPLIMGKRNYAGLKPTDEYSDGEIRRMIAGYYGAVSYVDYLLGIILEALISTNQLENTLVIFTSDHGEMLGDHRMLKKGAIMFEEMIRIPLLILAPGYSPTSDPIERRTEQLVSHVDLVPTILDYCGQPVPSGLPGRSLRPLLEGEDTQLRDGLAIEFHSNHWGNERYPLRAWRTQDWKYVETIGGDDELYHLAEDPLETRNLADTPAAADQKNRMKNALYRWMKRTGDTWPDIADPGKSRKVKRGVWDELADRAAGMKR